MSGGHWGYQREGLIDMGKDIAVILEVVGAAERIMDYAICGDTALTEAKERLWDLWESTFDRLYDS